VTAVPEFLNSEQAYPFYICLYMGLIFRYPGWQVANEITKPQLKFP